MRADSGLALELGDEDVEGRDVTVRAGDPDDPSEGADVQAATSDAPRIRDETRRGRTCTATPAR
jgi:hypothetical protein